MKRALAGLFSVALRLFPREFRQLYSSEMERVFAERLTTLSSLAAVRLTAAELGDVMLAATRARGARLVVARTATVGMVALSMLVTVVGVRSIASRNVGSPLPGDRMDFSAHDPAGEFSLTIREGRAVGASIDRIPFPIERLVHSGDSIRFLAPNGKVMLALAYYRKSGRIEWQARPRVCSDPASACGI